MRLTGAVAAFALVGGSCDSSGSEMLAPGPGTLIVLIASTGTPDLDGYRLTVDDGEPIPVDWNDQVEIPGLAAGSHTVELTGLDDPCVLNGPPARSVNIPGNGIVYSHFVVTCGWPCYYEYPYCVRLGGHHAPALRP
jgi:hypothetical protein